MYKIGNSIIKALFPKEHSRAILKEYINMIIKSGKTVIIEGTNINEVEILKNELDIVLRSNVIYTKEISKDFHKKF